MQETHSESRQSQRLLFSTKEAVTARIMKCEHPDADPIPVTILNLSEGGLGLAMARNALQTVAEREEIRLVTIEGGTDLSFLIGIRMEVRWLLHNPEMQHACLGCEFINPASAVIQMIRNIFSAKTAG
ncbi:MAG: PilZ domain-containing protein [Thermodesulfobacteriota bacterium]